MKNKDGTPLFCGDERLRSNLHIRRFCAKFQDNLDPFRPKDFKKTIYRKKIGRLYHYYISPLGLDLLKNNKERLKQEGAS